MGLFGRSRGGFVGVSFAVFLERCGEVRSLVRKAERLALDFEVAESRGDRRLARVAEERFFRASRLVLVAQQRALREYQVYLAWRGRFGFFSFRCLRGDAVRVVAAAPDALECLTEVVSVARAAGVVGVELERAEALLGRVSNGKGLYVPKVLLEVLPPQKPVLRLPVFSVLRVQGGRGLGQVFGVLGRKSGG